MPADFEAIKGIDFEVGDGQFLRTGRPLRLRPSRPCCGWSPGLETVSSGGEIDIGGRIVNQDRGRLIGTSRWCSRNYALLPAYDRLQQHGLRLCATAAMSEADIKTRVGEAARILELGAMLDRKPRQLSGGQRQRVAMGRAIVPAARKCSCSTSRFSQSRRQNSASRCGSKIRKLQRRLQHDIDLCPPMTSSRR